MHPASESTQEMYFLWSTYPRLCGRGSQPHHFTHFLSLYPAKSTSAHLTPERQVPPEPPLQLLVHLQVETGQILPMLMHPRLITRPPSPLCLISSYVSFPPIRATLDCSRSIRTRLGLSPMVAAAAFTNAPVVASPPRGPMGAKHQNMISPF
jgi:hypothetical protein